MSRRHRMLCKLFASLAVIAVLLTGPAFRLANAQVAAPAPVPAPDSINVEGYTVTEKDTGQVNAFLSAHPARAQFLANLTARGVNPADVKYVSVASSPAQGGADDLSLLASRLNEYQTSTGGSPVTSVDMWLGGYRASDGKLDGEVLLVANLEDGSQSLVSAVQADDATLAGAGTPNVMTGDFFGGAGGPSPSPDPGDVAPDQQRAVAIAAYLICWIQCIVIQQIIIILRCIVIAIVVCVGIGPFLICFGVKITICRLIILIRTIVICFINCVLVVIIVVPVFKVQPRQVGQNDLLNVPGRQPRFGPDRSRARDGLAKSRGGPRMPVRANSPAFGFGLAG